MQYWVLLHRTVCQILRKTLKKLQKFLKFLVTHQEYKYTHHLLLIHAQHFVAHSSIKFYFSVKVTYLLNNWTFNSFRKPWFLQKSFKKTTMCFEMHSFFLLILLAACPINPGEHIRNLAEGLFSSYHFEVTFHFKYFWDPFKCFQVGAAAIFLFGVFLWERLGFGENFSSRRRCIF